MKPYSEECQCPMHQAKYAADRKAKREAEILASNPPLRGEPVLPGTNSGFVDPRGPKIGASGETVANPAVSIGLTKEELIVVLAALVLTPFARKDLKEYRATAVMKLNLARDRAGL